MSDKDSKKRKKESERTERNNFLQISLVTHCWQRKTHLKFVSSAKKAQREQCGRGSTVQQWFNRITENSFTWKKKYFFSESEGDSLFYYIHHSSQLDDEVTILGSLIIHLNKAVIKSVQWLQNNYMHQLSPTGCSAEWEFQHTYIQTLYTDGNFRIVKHFFVLSNVSFNEQSKQISSKSLSFCPVVPNTSSLKHCRL